MLAIPPRFRRLAASSTLLGGFLFAVFWSPSPLDPAQAGMDGTEIARLQDEAAVMKRYQKWAKALPPLLALHRAAPENPTHLADLAEVYGHLGRYREEAAMWEQFLDRSPMPVEGCPQIGRAYEKQGLRSEALDAYKRCLSFDQNNLDSIFHLAHALERYGQVADAEGLYRKGYRLRPAYSDFGIGIARLALRRGEARESLELATKVIAEHPNNSDALLVAGLASDRIGDEAGAKRYLQGGAAISSDAEFQVALGRIAERDGNLDQAIAYYGKAVAIEGSGSEYAAKLALLRKARE